MKGKIKILSSLLGKTIVILLLSLLTYWETWAHEKWFVTSKEYQELVARGRPEIFNLPLTNLLWILAMLLGIGLFLVLALYLREKSLTMRLQEKLLPLGSFFAEALAVATGIVLVYAGFNQQFFAANLDLNQIPVGILVIPLSLIQIILGFSLIVGLYTRVSCLVILIAYLASSLLFPFGEWIDYVDVIGVALFLLLSARGRWRLDSLFGIRFLEGKKKYGAYALSLLRVFTGLDIFVLGFNNKILNPYIAMDLIEKNNLNFMKALGFTGFSNELFVLGAAFVETTVGLVILFGMLTRIVAVVLAILFSITLFLFGPIELIGHLPLFAVTYAFLTLGGGEYYRLEDLFQKGKAKSVG